MAANLAVHRCSPSAAMQQSVLRTLSPNAPAQGLLELWRFDRLLLAHCKGAMLSFVCQVLPAHSFGLCTGTLKNAIADYVRKSCRAGVKISV